MGEHLKKSLKKPSDFPEGFLTLKVNCFLNCSNMRPEFIIFITALFAISACRQSTTTHSVIHKQQVFSKKENLIKKAYPLTDSGQLMLHLDSLSRPPFPYLSEGRNYSPLITISLARFKNKKLFNLHLKLIPTQIGGDQLDHGLDVDENGMLPDSIKETFNLVDRVTYKAEGVLVATTPKFVVLDLDGTLLTMTYDVAVIDAITSSEGHGNNHWSVWRNTTIKKDLTMIIRQYYTHESHEEDDSETEYWFIDSFGHFQKKLSKVKKH
ncbi:MAG TPA: hypothetical protein VHZ50_10100 [Puia sp.]|nr:hypothetical protein [Puia sp.]